MKSSVVWWNRTLPELPLLVTVRSDAFRDF